MGIANSLVGAIGHFSVSIFWVSVSAIYSGRFNENTCYSLFEYLVTGV
jgi:hypothetical protein